MRRAVLTVPLPLGMQTTHAPALCALNEPRQPSTGDAGLFYHLDKSTVLQEARAFNETPINPRKCRLILTKIAYLLYQSETFATKEATETFFSITKLFQSPDVR